MKTPTEIAEKQSERIFWVIQTIFGFVIARSFGTFGSVFVPPFRDDILTILLALFAVYGCVLWSWIDFSYTLIVSPYNFRGKKLERYRFLSDLFIVLVYTYLLAYIEHIKDAPTADIFFLLCALSLVYLGYLISGVLRIIEYGRRASRVFLITIFLVLFSGLSLTYKLWCSHASSIEINRGFLIGIIVLNFAYRITRSKLSSRKKLIGVDVDGVLANQIDPLLLIIEKRYQMRLLYKDIIEWRFPVGDTSIDSILVEAQGQRPFIINMPLHSGARQAISKIIRKHRVAIATARPPESDEWTKQWLNNNNISFDAYHNLREGNKQNAQETYDILIDDYQGNISNFLAGHPEKGAILFSQPWNKDRTTLEQYEKQGRLKYVNSWGDVPAMIETLLSDLEECRRRRSKEETQQDTSSLNAGKSRE